MSKEETKKEKKTSDKSKKKKPNRIVKWFKDLKSEFKKVVWPTKKQVFNNTLVVLVTMVVSSAVSYTHLDVYKRQDQAHFKGDRRYERCGYG